MANDAAIIGASVMRTVLTDSQITAARAVLNLVAAVYRYSDQSMKLEFKGQLESDCISLALRSLNSDSLKCFAL